MASSSQKSVQTGWWGGLLSVVFLALFGLFLVQSRTDLQELRLVLPQTRPTFLALGALALTSYIVLQGWLYQSCYRITGHDFPWSKATRLYLKRFFLSSFVPAGFTLSQYTFTRDLEAHKIGPLESHLASSLYLLVGAVSYIVLLLPTIIFLLITGQLTALTWLASTVVVAMMLALIMVLVSVMVHRGFLYRLLKQRVPDFMAFLETWKHRSLNKPALVASFAASLLTHVVSIGLLWSVLSAMGVSDAWLLAMIGYVTTVLILILSPVFQGIGLVEFSLVYTLVQFGLDRSSAVAVTLLYRSFQLWVPFLVGLYLVAHQRVKENQPPRINTRGMLDSLCARLRRG